jgi:hypothetical protein
LPFGLVVMTHEGLKFDPLQTKNLNATWTSLSPVSISPWMQQTSLSPLSNSPFNFHQFSKNILKNTFCYKSPLPPLFCLEKTHQKVKRNSKNSPKKFITIAYNMEGCWRYLYFHILNIAKFGSTYFYMHVHHLSNITKLKNKTLELGGGKGSTLSNILLDR